MPLMPRLLKDLQINDVSSVDRGAGRGVRILLMKRDDSGDDIDKRDFSADQRHADADKGKALPDGSFPIENTGDLKNAVQAIGRAKDRGRAMAHIKRRAAALGATDLLPDSWKKNLEDDDSNVIDMTGLLHKGQLQETEMNAEQIKKQVEDAVAVAMKPVADQVAKLEAENQVLKDEKKFLSMSKAHQDFAKDMSPEDKKKFADKSDADRDEDCAKAEAAKVIKLDPVIQKRLEKADENEKLLKGLIEKDEIATFAKRATELGLPAEQGEILRKAHKGDAEAFTKVEELIAGLNKQMTEIAKTGKIFSEFGTSVAKSGSKAIDQLNAKAAELRKVDPKLSEQQAFAKVYADPANSEIVKLEKAERNQAAGIVAA